MKKSFKYIVLALIDQLPLRLFIQKFFITGNAKGLFYINSHISSVSGKEKQSYHTKQSAIRAAEAM